jgi:prepilin-type N-terminal cleavage/methylation domain-containing protein
MKRRIKTESGFTLLELLISLAMVAVIVTVCLMAVRLATASREAGNQKADIQQRLRVLHERLHSTLRSAHLIFVDADSNSLIPDESEEQSDNSKILAFEGNPESLRFVTFGEKLMAGENSPSMHEVHFYLQKNEDTGLLDVLLNERDFSPKNFFKQNSTGLETGQTLRIAQDVSYLKFRYYYEISSEKGSSTDSSEKKELRVSGEWADKLTTEPIDFKSTIVSDKNTAKDTGNSKEAARLPKAVEISVGLWEAEHPKEGSQQRMVELPPILILIQAGMVFERFEGEEESDASGE